MKTRSRQRRRPRRRGWLAGILIGGVTLVALLAVLVPIASSRDPLALCVSQPATFPDSGVDGWEGEQLENAAVIVRTAKARGFGREGQIIGVMAAMGESSLRNIDYGDWETSGVTNPDGTRTSSIGLFQQQDWWGSAEDRMDPATSAGLFYARLARLRGWQDLEPTIAIHRVQINSDPEHYARFEAEAISVVEALSGPCP
ncbi:hypothetical protein MZK47_15065 [Microbacterium aerolatum]|uniref:hypothetical protein n=1 Tax=Microbacterium aerolatum TaxID=153731 RepID=UPI002001496F|nr:hypothetical protein [Microbacterium aerolatum]MCK3770991.1 hypothetical protein [Microbacterium aerolatum]